MHSSSSVSRTDSSSPKLCSPSEALWSTPKHVATINRVRNHCPRAMEKFRRKVTPSGADRISTSARDGAPVLEATMAYRSACPRRNLRTVAVCWPRIKGWSPVVRLSLLSILNPRAMTNFSRDGVAMVGARRPISSAVPSNAC